MSDKIEFPDARIEIVAAVERKPPSKTLYLVAAWSHEWGWSVRRDTGLQEFDTREKAEDFVEKLPKHWTHWRILKVEL